jgi:hypothetical protein
MWLASMFVAALSAQIGTLDLVQVVGCLSPGAGGTWVVTSGTRPAAAKDPWTTAAAVKEAATRPLGTQRYRLIGVVPFDPASRAGHKVAVKGVLIKADAETRINVTSLQTAGETCR